MRLLLMAGGSEQADLLMEALELESVQVARGSLESLWEEQGGLLQQTSGQLARDGEYDAVLLCLEQREGIAGSLPELRQNCELPIVVAGSLTENCYYEEMFCLQQGADDYFRASMPVPVMVVRIRRLMALYRSMPGEVICQKGLDGLPQSRDYRWRGKRLGLTDMEYRVLSLLLRSREEIVPREKMLAMVWQGKETQDSHVLTAIVRKLRKKLAFTPVRIVSCYGKGYRVEEEH